MQQELVASWIREDGIPYVSAEGELTIATAPLLDKELFEARSDDPFTVVLRLERCTYCDSAGLAIILRHARQTPHFVVVSPLNSPVRRLLRITRADEQLDVVTDIELIRLYFPPEHQPDGLDHALEVG
jgi:anti-anti-sigma factor